MGICTQCGAVMNDEDLQLHKCLIEDLPDKGKPIRKGQTKQSTQ